MFLSIILAKLNYMKKYKCVCEKEFLKAQSFNAHKSRCKIHLLKKYGDNAFYENLIKAMHAKNKKTEKKTKEVHCVCEKCNKSFIYHYNKRFCSYKCANSRTHTKETKHKISIACSKAKQKNNQNLNIKKYKYCKICGNTFEVHSKSLFCSKTCKHLSNRLSTYIKYFNLNINTIGTQNIFNEVLKIKNILYNLYWIEEQNASDICKIFKYPSTQNLLNKIFKYLDIKKRTLSESNSIAALKKKNNKNKCYKYKYKHGWHKTWNNNNIFYRSSLELNYAKKLDELKIEYYTEYIRIRYFDSVQCKQRTAIVDFYLPIENKLIEIKSTYTFDKQNMIDKATKYIELGYKFSLILNNKEYSFEELKTI